MRLRVVVSQHWGRGEGRRAVFCRTDVRFAAIGVFPGSRDMLQKKFDVGESGFTFLVDA